MLQQELYTKLIAQNPSSDNAMEFLQSQVNEYPYFGTAHFFLLKETADTDVDYKKSAAKTALHFNNPFFLKFQLDKKAEKVAPVSNIKEIENTTTSNIPAEIAEPEESVTSLEQVIPAEKEITHEIVEESRKEELLFEPLHASDYFASQGIKLSEEVQPADKLGKQLKSFTDWLKTMKKVQQGSLPEGNTQIDIAVQSLAEKSNKEQEILTESMAEVFVQQGKLKKAHDLYKKLSLLNPAKSAYFAAKIELLKEN